MKLELTFGCIAYSLTIDGKQEIDLTNEQRIECINRIFEWYRKNPTELNSLLQYFVESHADDYECSDKPCECCGDVVSTYKMEI